MSRLRAALVFGVLVLLHAFTALADADAESARRPPPDVAHGESFDGRARAGPTRDEIRNDLLVVPRLVLSPLRLVMRALSYPFRWVVEWGERHHIPRRALRLVTSEDGQIGVRPSVSYTAGFRPIFGATFFDRKLLGPATAFDLTLTGADQNNLFTEVHLRPTHEHRALEADFDAIYNRRNDQLFTGIGMNVARSSIGSRYAVDELDLRGHLHLTPAPAVRLEFGGRFGLRRFGDGQQLSDDQPITRVFCVRDGAGACVSGAVDERLVPGFHDGTQFVRGLVALRVDTRDSVFRPTSGAMVHLETQYTHGVGADRSSYFRLHGGLEAVVDLWQRTRVLVFRVISDALVPTGSEVVPFTELVVVGGHDDLRGLRPGKFRDFTSLLATVEYRWPVWMWMDAQLFVDYGGVFGRGYAGFAVDKLVPSFGGGLRVRTQSEFFLRMQTAYSLVDGWQFFFGASVEP